MPQLTLCDDSGKLLGYFLPAEEYERMKRLEAEHRRLLYAWAKAQFTDEEIERAEADPEEFTTAEVLKYLESL